MYLSLVCSSIFSPLDARESESITIDLTPVPGHERTFFGEQIQCHKPESHSLRSMAMGGGIKVLAGSLGVGLALGTSNYLPGKVVDTISWPAYVGSAFLVFDGAKDVSIAALIKVGEMTQLIESKVFSSLASPTSYVVSSLVKAGIVTGLIWDKETLRSSDLFLSVHLLGYLGLSSIKDLTLAAAYAGFNWWNCKEKIN